LVDIYLFLIEKENIEGVVNAASPNFITQKEFYYYLADSLGKKFKLILPIPEILLKLLLKENYLLLSGGQKVLPKVLLDNKFKFEFENIKDCLNNVTKTNGI
jgi:NAD dependent epimerase/dehydratase family enzyme